LFLNTALRNPGIVFRCEDDLESIFEENTQDKQGPKRALDICDTCGALTPDHMDISHCYMCGYCIEGLDHHCPWMGQCIGKQNKR
jgi:palmitoyltransferase ZDHHC9/14/18